MELHSEKDGFHYTYSALEHEEVMRICQKYIPKKPDKLEQLKKLDRSAEQKGIAAALTVGILGALILGTGMCCTLVWADRLFLPGILIGIVGIALIAAAYPLFQHITRKEREKIAPEVLRLTDELLK